jgi:hypothetical protein
LQPAPKKLQQQDLQRQPPQQGHREQRHLPNSSKR